MKDLGTIITNDLKFHKQVGKVCARANREINRVRRCFLSRNPEFLSEMFKLYICTASFRVL